MRQLRGGCSTDCVILTNLPSCLLLQILVHVFIPSSSAQTSWYVSHACAHSSPVEQPLVADGLLLAPVCLSFTFCQNIPGLDAPSWSRTGGVDETQEAEEEAVAEKRWRKEQQQMQVKVGHQQAGAGFRGVRFRS